MPTSPPDIYYFIDPSLHNTNKNENVYNDLQSALDHANENCAGRHAVINLAPGNYVGNELYKGRIRVYNNQHLIGTSGVHFKGFHCHGEYTNNIVIESVTFSSRRTLNFGHLKGVVFRNCTFKVCLIGCKKDCGEAIGIKFDNCGEVEFDNCKVRYNVQKFRKFEGMKFCNTKHFITRSGSTRIVYKNVKRIELYHFKGNKGSCSEIPYFQSFTDAIYVKQHKKHCGSSRVKLIQTKHRCQPSILAADVTIKGKRGRFDIAEGQKPIYITGLIVKTNRPRHWKIGTLVNTLLSGFISNLEGACNLKKCECIKGSCSSSSSSSCSSSSSDDCGECNNFVRKITTVTCDDSCSSSSSSSCSPCKKKKKCSSSSSSSSSSCSPCKKKKKCSSSSSSSCSSSSSSSCSSSSSGKQKCPSKNPSFSSSSSSDCCSSSSSSDCSSSSSSDCSSSSSSDCSSSSSSDCSSSSGSDCSSSSSSDCSSSSSSSSSDCKKCKY